MIWVLLCVITILTHSSVMERTLHVCVYVHIYVHHIYIHFFGRNSYHLFNVFYVPDLGTLK